MIARDPLYDVLRLAEEVRPAWDGLSAEIPAWHPRNEGEEGGEGEGEGGEADKVAAAAAALAAAKGEEGDGATKKTAEDYRVELRKSDDVRKREAAKANKRIQELEATLAKIEQSNMSAQDKAIATARAEAAGEVTTKYEQKIRAGNLKLAVLEIASDDGVKLGEGDKAKTVKFAKSSDVLMWVKHQIAEGVMDEADIYGEDGSVNKAALTAALADLAESRPGWLSGAATRTSGTPAGDPDVGKGKSGTAVPDMNDLIRGRRG
jgi:hypothetical protein